MEKETAVGRHQFERLIVKEKRGWGSLGGLGGSGGAERRDFVALARCVIISTPGEEHRQDKPKSLMPSHA